MSWKYDVPTSIAVVAKVSDAAGEPWTRLLPCPHGVNGAQELVN